MKLLSYLFFSALITLLGFTNSKSVKLGGYGELTINGNKALSIINSSGSYFMDDRTETLLQCQLHYHSITRNSMICLASIHDCSILNDKCNVYRNEISILFDKKKKITCDIDKDTVFTKINLYYTDDGKNYISTHIAGTQVFENYLENESYFTYDHKQQYFEFTTSEGCTFKLYYRNIKSSLIN